MSKTDQHSNEIYDYVIIGSGFGGSVSALRLVQKGYRVLVLEKGRRFSATDFPKRNWNVKRWIWLPFLRLFGFFKITFFRHVTVLSGVGVGGGSLVYANTLPVPKDEFFELPSWAHLADWKSELSTHYQTALKMLGAQTNPELQIGENALQKLADLENRSGEFEPTRVAVFFGEPDEETDDPYFEGEGPRRSGCNFCGGCMVGCRYDAKNTLDKNYLYLAEKNGAELRAESEVLDVRPLAAENGNARYQIEYRKTGNIFAAKKTVQSRGIIFAGGVLGTVPLLLKLKKFSLPNLSDKIGAAIRTNSESLLGVTSTNKNDDFSKGVAIGAKYHTDDHSHLELVRYPAGSGFWRILMSPMVSGSNMLIRFSKILADIIAHPVRFLKVYFVKDWAKQTQILLFMQTINSTLKFSKGWLGLKSNMEAGRAPTAFIPEALDLARKFAKIVGGKPVALLSETLLGIPTTAHILGGAVMGRDKSEGVIDKDQRVFGYPNMFVCDGSAVSANPGVNPALTISAMTERAMSKIPAKDLVKTEELADERAD